MQELFPINENIRKYESVIIYGVGKSGKGVLLKLLQYNIKVECFVDASPEKCVSKYLNIPVIHIDDLSDKKDAAIIVCGIHAFDVARELTNRGFINLFIDYANEIGLVHLEREDLI